MHWTRVSSILAGAVWIVAATQQPAGVDASFLRTFAWRNIGPFRGGTTTAAVGVVTQPNVFYIGAAHGGVWKTTDAGRTWTPIFDEQSTGTIGALAVATPDGNVIYAGTAEGIFRSADGGRSWTKGGLADAEQIAEIVVDPHDANRVFVAALGHAYGANAERGVFRSIDGGKTFTRVLYVNDDTGAVDVALDPENTQVIYAALWESRRTPWAGGEFTGPGTGLQKSTDGGATWRPIGNGLPAAADGLGRIAIAVAPTRTARLFALVQADRRGGVYRSDDAGASWSLVNTTAGAPLHHSNASDIVVDPKNPEVVYATGAAAWKSTDAGVQFRLWRSASTGPYRRLWINASTPASMILATDQGAAVSINGGTTWSSRLNQPTAELTSVRTDNAVPYRICGGGPRGTGCLPSRTDRGVIEVRDWIPLAAFDTPIVAPDPADADIVYGGRVVRFDRRTAQTHDVRPPADADFRTSLVPPVGFSPVDQRTLFFAGHTLWRTATAGQSWTEISRDLSRDTWIAPANIGVYRTSPAANFSRRGAISTVAPSFIDPGTIWAGTDDGLVHVTRDGGKTWSDVTPPALQAWAAVESIEASHFDANTAYAVVDRTRLDDRRPSLFKTRDGGYTWTDITKGFPERGVIHAVREDASRRGLLYAGTDRSVFVSMDDGESWLPLGLNLPPVRVRDLAVKEADVIIATEGRGFWVLDDVMPLRQITADIARAPAYLFRPAVAWRLRTGQNADARGADELAAPNPPDGVTISYLLGAPATGPVTIEIIETASGELIRKFSSEASEIASDIRLATTPGVHRVLWDIRYTPPAYEPPADGADRPRPSGPWVLPGTYQVRLTANGTLFRQAVVVRIDPRVKVPVPDLIAQLTLSKTVANLMTRLLAERADVDRALAGATTEDLPKLNASRAALTRAYAPLPALLITLQRADAKPTQAVEAAVSAAIKDAEAALTRSGDFFDLVIG